MSITKPDSIVLGTGFYCLLALLDYWRFRYQTPDEQEVWCVLMFFHLF